MKIESMEFVSMDRHEGCLGGFDSRDRVCRSHCALRLRCAIEKERNLRTELLEELVSVEHLLTRIQ